MIRVNNAAAKKAAQDTGNSKFIGSREFWREHPEYGYREAPVFHDGQHSIFMDDGLQFLGFWDLGVWRECDGVRDNLRRLFKPYSLRKGIAA